MISSITSIQHTDNPSTQPIVSFSAATSPFLAPISISQAYKVDSGASYYWIDQQGSAIVGTNSPAQPSVDFSVMTQLP